MWILYALLSAIFASLVAIFAKPVMKEFDSTFVTFLRAIIMTIFLFFVVIIGNKFKQIDYTIKFYDWILIFCSAIAGALSWIFYFAALREGLASAVTAIDRTSIIFVIIFAGIFLNENVTIMKLLGGILVFLGSILVTLNK